jgi:hypothetical protein
LFSVVINCYSFEDLVFGSSDVSAQFNIGFGASYYHLLYQALGDYFQVAEVRSLNKENELAAIFPFSERQHIRSAWALKISRYAPEWAKLIESGKDVAIMNFSSVNPLYKGHAAVCFQAVADALLMNGYNYGITEVQWLKQLLLWQRKGWKNITPVPENMELLYMHVSRHIKNNDNLSSFLTEGQKLIWHHEQIYSKPKWNLILDQPIFLIYLFNRNKSQYV